MPLQDINTVVGLVTGKRIPELPGVLVDLNNFDVLLFGVNPHTHTMRKTLEIQRHRIPGRHAPLKEPIAGGDDVLTMDLLFYGYDPVSLAATKQAVHWLQSLCYPTVGGVLDTLRGLLATGFAPSAVEPFTGNAGPIVTEVGRPVSLTFGTWIIERRYLVEQVEVQVGPGQHPALLMPYRAAARLTLVEDEPFTTFLEHRYGIPQPGNGLVPRV